MYFIVSYHCNPIDPQKVAIYFENFDKAHCLADFLGITENLLQKRRFQICKRQPDAIVIGVKKSGTTTLGNFAKLLSFRSYLKTYI